MSRENSRDRSGGRTPESMKLIDEPQKILNLDSSPGSSRKLEGDEEIIHVPNFSKEISLDSEEDILEKKENVVAVPTQESIVVPEQKVSASPKGILKRKLPERARPLSGESPRNSKCCHPFVEKIKHIADKTIHKADKHSPKRGIQKKKVLVDKQEIIMLDKSPGSERRDRIKLANIKQDEPDKNISLVMENQPQTNNNLGSFEIEILDSSPSSKKRRDHIYEDIEGEKKLISDDSFDNTIAGDVSDVGIDNRSETKSGDSKDPSLFFDEPMDQETVSESVNHVKAMFDTSMTPSKPIDDVENDNVLITKASQDTAVDQSNDAVSAEVEHQNESPNITITEVTEDGLTDRHLNLDDMDLCAQDRRVHFDMSDTNNKSNSEEATSPENGSENFWSKISDHEYEPVGKPLEDTCEITKTEPMSTIVIECAGETTLGTKSVEDPEWLRDDASSTTSHERQFLHPVANDEDNDALSGMEHEPDEPNAALQLQKEIEDRYFVNTPTTTESRTDCEISTSQVDSSAIENLPLKRENRKKNTVAQETAKLRQKISTQTGKIRNHAGKIKTKLKTIKKPQFNMPERPKFTMPERPKFNFPERPKFNMPDRPKINLPERPKFKMPERPKINLPDRPKINFPERPKFNFPDRPKINFPERPKFNLPDRSKFKLPDRPKLNFASFSRSSKENRTSNDETVTTEPSTSSKKNFLDFDFRTYPRIFNKNKKKRDASGERPGTPPPPGFATVPRPTKDRQQIVASVWEHASSRTTDDEPRHYGIDYSYDKEPDFQTKLAQVEKDFREMEQDVEDEKNTLDPVTRATLENKEKWNAIERNTVQQLEHGSSLPHISSNENRYGKQPSPDDDESSAASAGQHRRGVLEEINNDEFFLRQKGISQDNIEVGKYLSNEIRDAFRSPINALSQIDQDFNNVESTNLSSEQINGQDMEHFDPSYKNDMDDKMYHDQEEPNQNHNMMLENDDGYYTFPPVRPSRAKKLKTLVQELPREKVAIAYDENDEEFANIHLETIPTPSIFSDVENKKEIENNLESFQKRVFGNSFKETEILDNLNEYENEMEQTKEVPTIPRRRRKNPSDTKFSESESCLNDNIIDGQEEWMNSEFADSRNDMDDEINEHPIERVLPVGSNVGDTPVAPRRSRSRGSRTTSVGDDDRTSRGAESLILDSNIQMNNIDLDYMDDNDECPGYATVDKSSQPKEEMPPPRPPPPKRKRSAKSLSGDRQFFTVPRALNESSPPKRPSRNYSTLGPSRPPRKKSTTSLSGLDSIRNRSSSGDVTQYVEIEDDETDLHKDLKSGEVVSKMKDRPLPPPPRPPRGPKKKKDSGDDEVFDNELNEHVTSQGRAVDTIHTTESSDERIIADSNNNTFIQNANTCAPSETKNNIIPYETLDQDQVIEIEVSTQTDPLPDDFDYDLGIDEPLSENFDMRNSFTDLTKEEAEENSIDVELMNKGLQKFRESSRPGSRSSKLKSPVDRPKTPLGRMSPTAILVERRVSSPTRINEHQEIVTEASLTVQPIDEPLIIEEPPSAPVHRYYPTASDVLHSMNVAHVIPDHSVIPEQINREDIHENHIKPEEIMQTEQTISENILIPDLEELQSKKVEPMQSEKPKSKEAEEQQIPHESILQQESNASILKENVSKETIIGSQNLTPVAQSYPSALPCEPSTSSQITQNFNLAEVDIMSTQRLRVSDLDVERLSVSELQASKILVTDIEGLTLQVNDVNSKSGHIYVRGLELAPGVIEDLLEKFSQLVTAPVASTSATTEEKTQMKSDVNEETQTDEPIAIHEFSTQTSQIPSETEKMSQESLEPPPRPPPPPTMHPAMFQPIPCYPDFHLPSSSYYRFRRPMETRQGDISDDDIPPPTRSRKHRREKHVSSSEDEDYKPVARRIPASQKPAEPQEASVSELSLQLFRACQNSVSRTINQIVTYIKKHFSDVQSKKEVEMAVVIFLVMAAGLIMLSLGDGRTVHHHHWDFINPPNGNGK